jgi:hypothetical protein
MLLKVVDEAGMADYLAGGLHRFMLLPRSINNVAVSKVQGVTLLKGSRFASWQSWTRATPSRQKHSLLLS